jgi:hypothetical protein
MHHVTINQKNQKKGRQREGNLPPRKLSPKKCLQKSKKQKNSLSTSKRTGSKIIPTTAYSHPLPVDWFGARGRCCRANEVLLWIGSPGAMATANAMRTELALRTLRSRSTRLEWMGIPSRCSDCEPNEVGWEERGSMRCRQVGRSGRHLRATRRGRSRQLRLSWHRKSPLQKFWVGGSHLNKRTGHARDVASTSATARSGTGTNRQRKLRRCISSGSGLVAASLVRERAHCGQ